VIRATEEFLPAGTIKLAKHPGEDWAEHRLEVRYPEGQSREAAAASAKVRRVAGGFLCVTHPARE